MFVTYINVLLVHSCDTEAGYQASRSRLELPTFRIQTSLKRVHQWVLLEASGPMQRVSPPDRNSVTKPATPLCFAVYVWGSLWVNKLRNADTASPQTSTRKSSHSPLSMFFFLGGGGGDFIKTFTTTFFIHQNCYHASYLFILVHKSKMRDDNFLLETFDCCKQIGRIISAEY